LSVQELLEKCNPLGMFDAIASLAVAQNMRDLYRLVLVDTPLAPYFSENLTHEDLDEMNIEVIEMGCRVRFGVRRMITVGPPSWAAKAVRGTVVCCIGWLAGTAACLLERQSRKRCGRLLWLARR
jgi:hypothetical protein